MKLLTCEYMGRTFAAVSDGKDVWEAAPDMATLIRSLKGALPERELMEGEALPLTHRQAMNLFFGPWSPERLRLPAFAAGWFPLSLFVPEVDND